MEVGVVCQDANNINSSASLSFSKSLYRYTALLPNTSVNAVLDAIQSGNPLIRLLFDRNCEHFGALEFSTEARALLADRAYSTVMLSSVGGL